MNQKRNIIMSLKQYVNFGIIITLNMRVMVTKIGTYHQMNILTQLKLTSGI